MEKSHSIKSFAFLAQTSLKHRGDLGANDSALFPPPESFAAIGGREAIAKLVDGLYDRIELDRVLRPAFNRDLTKEREKQKLFFEAWLGGSPSYFDAGWPLGLKAAHASVSISQGMAERWLGHFRASLSQSAKDPKLVKQLQPFISQLAIALVSRLDEPLAGERLRDVSDSRFLRAVQRNDAEGISEAATASPHVLPLHGPKLLLVSVLRGKLRVVEELLRQGVDVNRVAMPPGSDAKLYHLPGLRMTPLCAAVASHRESLANLLIEHGAQYDIFTASCLGDIDAVRELLDLAPELADASDPGCDVAQISPLMHAVFAGQFEVAQLLLQRGATLGKNSVRLVRAAANLGHETLTNLLLDYGATPTAIGAGLWVMYPAIADKLLALGAKVNHEEGAWIGLCCTGNSGHKENAALVRAMLGCGADVNARYKGRSALHCAAKAGFLKVVKVLIEYGGDVNAFNNQGQSPLDELDNARQSAHKETMRRLLIAHGARHRLN
jgi:truncated hemoglobin YjbI/ankyrin repeat protein